MSPYLILLTSLIAFLAGCLLYAVTDVIREALNDRKREVQRADAHVAKMRARHEQDSSRRGTFNPTRSQ